MRFDRLTSDDETPASVRGGPSKAELRNMLTQAVLNTGGTPVVPKRASEKPKPEAPAANLPTAYQIAVAIVAAARECGVDPEGVANGLHGQNLKETSRARAYAAIAIRTVFPDSGVTAVGRWVGSGSPQVYVSILVRDRKEGRLKWWDEAAFMRIVDAIEAE